MSLDKILKNLDITKVKAPSGLTYGQELVEAANLLSNCIQSKIHQRTMQHSISTADLADIKVEGNRMSITLKIQNSIRPSIFKKWNKSDAKDILDLDVYKKLKLQKARVDNYKAIVVEIPIDEDAVDKPLLTEDTLTVFAEMNKANMPEDVGLLHVPGNAEAVSFKDNANSTNNLSDAVTNLYDNAGVPHELFNAGSTGTAFKLSLENDAWPAGWLPIFCQLVSLICHGLVLFSFTLSFIVSPLW